MSFFLTTKAQDSVVQLPDSVGKYLFELFVNKADPDNSEIPFVETDFSNPKDMWSILLEKIDKYNLSPKVTQYYNTFFQQRRYKDIFYPAELYVSMEHEGEVYAFRLEVRWKGNHWQVEYIDSDLYLYSQNEEFEPGFINISNDEVLLIGPKPQFNKGFKSTVNTFQPQILPTPDSFSKKILKLLSEEAPFGSDEIFLTREEYLSTEGVQVLKIIEKSLQKESDLEDEEKKLVDMYNNPGLLYDEHINNWDMLSQSLKEEFGDIKELTIQDIELEISNWDRENGAIDIPQISAIVNMPLHYNGKDAGIYFCAIWYNGMWKLSHIQGFAYGISSAESVEAESVEEEAVAVEVE